ncbi:MAG: DPP IV N-terminal domain-containing protein, partial [Candidatus Aminicenantes bacterium]|nr:DPP IV N-terminal domain-containing protein [Candidatus Aminicenantes bacterium]
NKKLKSLGPATENIKTDKFGKRSPDGKWIIYSKGHNLYVKSTSTSNSIERQITNDGEKWFSYSVNEKSEDGNKEEGTIGEWFSDSKKIYCLRKDKRKVKDLFLVHSLSTPRPTLESYKYAMAGDAELAGFHISIIDIKSGEIREINSEKWKNQQIGSEGVTGIYPGDNSSSIYFIRTSRDWKDVELCEADTSTGKVKILLKERSEPYWSADFQQFYKTGENGNFIWWSEKSGRGHIYLHNNNGEELKQLTSGEFTVADIISIDKDKKYIYFTAYGMDKNEDPYYKKYYRIGFDGNGFTKLTPESGTHTIHMSASLKYYIDTYSTIEDPDISVLKDIEGNIILKIEELDTTKLRSSGWIPPIKFKVKAADNITDLHGVIWKPFKMEKGRKYPVISYVYPGPQGEPVQKTFFQVRDKRMSNIPLAQLGFIVITVGQRGGSPLRSREYHNYGYGNARDYPLADNKYAIEQLADRYDFIDINRVGIYGRSGGGFMAAAAILVYPGFYKTAVSSCGNH